MNDKTLLEAAKIAYATLQLKMIGQYIPMDTWDELPMFVKTAWQAAIEAGIKATHQPGDTLISHYTNGAVSQEDYERLYKHNDKDKR